MLTARAPSPLAMRAVIYKDVVTGDELVSDAFDLNEVDDFFYEVDGKMIMVGGETIHEYSLDPALEVPGAADQHEGRGDLALREARDLFERRFILTKLREHDGNVRRTAEALNIERSHLYRKMKAYGIEPSDVTGD